jgi:hypothetical protein
MTRGAHAPSRVAVGALADRFFSFRQGASRCDARGRRSAPSLPGQMKDFVPHFFVPVLCTGPQFIADDGGQRTARPTSVRGGRARTQCAPNVQGLVTLNIEIALVDSPQSAAKVAIAAEVKGKK